MGIEAYHENNQRGHCDITIKLNRFTWHGEAKNTLVHIVIYLKGMHNSLSDIALVL